jgi:hypothetical protein
MASSNIAPSTLQKPVLTGQAPASNRFPGGIAPARIPQQQQQHYGQPGQQGQRPGPGMGSMRQEEGREMKQQQNGSSAPMLGNSKSAGGAAPKRQIQVSEKDLYLPSGGLRQFMPNIIRNYPSAIVALVGKRNSGKSIGTRHILYEWQHAFGALQIHSGSEGSNDFYKKFAPDLFIFDGMDFEGLLAFYRKQQELKNNAPIVQGKSTYRPGLVVLDDVFATSADDIKKNETMSEIIFNGRHCECGLLICLQEIKQLPPKFRSQIDLLVMFADETQRGRKDLYGTVGGTKTQRGFDALMDKYTDGFSTLVCNKLVRSNNLEDRFFFWTATKDLGDWKFGGEDHDLWKCHRKYYKQKQKQTVEWKALKTGAEMVAAFHSQREEFKMAEGGAHKKDSDDDDHGDGAVVSGGKGRGGKGRARAAAKPAGVYTLLNLDSTGQPLPDDQ